MTECGKKTWSFYNCKFEPRYDYSKPDFQNISKARGLDEDLIRAMCSKTYVHDICVNCGKIVKR